MNEIEKTEKLIACWEGFRDEWGKRNCPISQERIVYCSEKIAYYQGYLLTLKLLDKLPQKS